MLGFIIIIILQVQGRSEGWIGNASRTFPAGATYGWLGVGGGSFSLEGLLKDLNSNK